MILSYAITDPAYYGNLPEEIKSKAFEVLKKHKIDLICFRDKESSYNEYLVKAKSFLSLKKDFPKTLFFLHTHYQLTQLLSPDGIHIPSKMLSSINGIKKEIKIDTKIIVSVHSLKEAELAQSFGIYAITYSPIFYTPKKPKPKGLEKLKEIAGKIDTKIFALGGILTQDQIDAVERAGAAGFASIRYFVD